MAESSTNKPKHPCSVMESLGISWGKDCKLPCPVTVAGATSYGLLAANMFNPDLLHRISPHRDLTNIIVGGTLVGGTLYLSGRPHLAAVADKKQRILFSVYGSTMITLGSLLLWAMVRVMLPDNAAARTVVGVGSSIILLKTGVAYLHVIDGAVTKKASSK